MSIQRHIRKTIGATLHSKIPSPEDNHLFRQWVFTEYPVSGFGDVWENKVDSLPLEIRVDALTYLFLYLYGCMYANIDCFLPSPSPLPKKGGIKTHIFVTWFFFFNFIYLFIYLWLCWVFVSVRGLSLVVASGGHTSSRYTGLSLSRPLLLRSTGSRCAGSVIVAHGPSCSAACGIFPDQGLNPCRLHWQADSQPLRHQGSPWFFKYLIGYIFSSHYIQIWIILFKKKKIYLFIYLAVLGLSCSMQDL